MTRLSALAGGLAAALALAACSQQRAGGPAPVSFGTEAQAPSAAGVVTVAAGDTLYEIARRYNVPARELIVENGLQPPYGLRVGQRLLLPTARFHLIQKGDTLYAVSRMYQVDMAELARTNDLQPPYNIRIGQSLRLPAAAGGVPSGGVALAQAPVRAPASSPAPAAAPVVISQSPAAVASAPAPAMQPPPASVAPPQSVAAAPSPPTPRPGSKPTQIASTASPAAPAPAQVAALPPAPSPSPVPEPAPAAQPAPAPSAPPPAVEEAPPRGSGRFVWPARGTVLSEFGPKSGGLHNDGINIAAPKGTSVFSAENGVVAYAGNELRGFGNLLLIRHADGWMTAYAHLDGMQVARGDKVTRGQKIGTVGSTGNVGEPQLHFEVRKGSRAVDPREFLDGKKSLSRAASPADRPGPG